MKKTTLTKIVSILTMLAMLSAFVAVFATGVSAETTAEAVWGTDAANLTESGTLKEAFEAAESDSSITYIKLMNDVALGTGYIWVEGGKFTFDLNGKTITGDSYPLSLRNSTDITIEDTSIEQTGKIESTSAGAAALTIGDLTAVKLTIKGGTFKGKQAVYIDGNGSVTLAEVTITGGKFIGSNYVVRANGMYLAVFGGEFEGGNWGQICWNSGKLDFSNHPAPAGLTVYNGFGSDVTLNGENIILPEGCYISDTSGGSAVTTLTSGTEYYIAGERVAPPEPAPEETTSEEPAPEETTSEEPAPEETTSEEPAPEETTSEEPEPEETTSEEPAPEETTSEEPTPEETTSEEPAPEEPDPCDHAGSAHVSATDNEDGTHTYICTLCSEENLIEDHNFIDGVCLCGATEVIELDPNAEAHWGTDAANLTESGTLQKALDAAAADTSITYIKVMNDVNLTSGSLNATGGKFTLDLNGKTVEGDFDGLLYLQNAVNITVADSGTGGKLYGKGNFAISMWDNSNVRLTIEGGTIESAEDSAITLASSGQFTEAELIVTGGTLRTNDETSSAIHASGKSVKIEGGSFESSRSNFYWRSGTLDFSAHPNLAGVTLGKATEEDVVLDGTLVKLPDGYSFYNSRNVREDEVLKDEDYTIDQTKYSVTAQTTTNGSFELSPGTGEILIGTDVIVTATPNDGYMVDEILVNGVAIEGNTFTLTEDVTVIVTFKPHQANWGTDVENLTESGTLQEALDAAAADGTVGYIRVMNDVILDVEVLVRGGDFTLDLNGKMLETTSHHLMSVNVAANIKIVDTVGNGVMGTTQSGTYAIAVLGEESVHITVDGVTLQGKNGAILMQNGNATVNLLSGTLKGDSQEIYLEGGKIDLSAGADPTGIRIFNAQGHTIKIDLPAGYSFYNASNEKVTVLAPEAIFTVARTKYALTVEHDDGVVIESDSSEATMHLPGTEIVIPFELEESYILVSVTLNGVAIEPDAETGEYAFVMPEGDATFAIKTKQVMFAWGTSVEEMTQIGNFRELVEAINTSGSTVYAQLLLDWNFDLSQNVIITGKAVIDLNGKWMTVSSSEDSARTVLADGADITFVADQAVDSDLYVDYDNASGLDAYVELQAGSKLTVTGANAYLTVYYKGGKLDISGAHWESYVDVYNITEAEVAVADFLTLGKRFRAVDFDEWLAAYKSGTPIVTIPTFTTIPVWDGEAMPHYFNAVYTVTLDYGEGSGSLTSFEAVPGEIYANRIPVNAATHPDGLFIIGWNYTYQGESFRVADSFYYDMYADLTLTAEWGAPLYVGGVAMFDGDYLASGATEASSKKPITGGYAYFKDGVLTLNNYEFEGAGFSFDFSSSALSSSDYALIYSANDLVIRLEGENTLNGIVYEGGSFGAYYEPYNTDGIRVLGNLTVCGEGSLFVNVIEDGLDVRDLFFESGKLTVFSEDEAIDALNITVTGGILATSSDDGIDANSVTVKGGEFYVLALDEEWNSIRLEVPTLTVEGGMLVVRGGSIESDYITISGGVVEVQTEYDVAIQNTDDFYYGEGGPVTPFLKISGGKVILSSMDEESIYFLGDITISGGELSINSYTGIVFFGKAFITGGDININADYFGICVNPDSALTIQGGNVIISGDRAIIADDGGISITGGRIALKGELTTYNNATIHISGKTLALLLAGDIQSDSVTIVEEDFKEVVNMGFAKYIEGVNITHTWSENYQFNADFHWHECTDEDCPLLYFGGLIGTPDIFYRSLAEAAYGEHSIPEGEENCICGYPNSVPGGEVIPNDVILLVGDHYLTAGDYLTNDGKIVREKPEGGYLYVTLNLDGEIPLASITLSNFRFEYTGQMAMFPFPVKPLWEILLVGDNVITAHAGTQIKADLGVPANGVGIFAAQSTLVIHGEGNLTINADMGIVSVNSMVAIVEGATVNVNAKLSGVQIMDGGDLYLNNATLNIVSEQRGLEISSGIESRIEKGNLTIRSKNNLIENQTMYVNASKVDIVASETAIEVNEATLAFGNSDVSITSYGKGFLSSYEGYVEIFDSKFTLSALGAAFYGELWAYVEGDNVDVSIRGSSAFSESFGVSIYDSYNYLMNAYYDSDSGYFYDENENFVNYVTIRSSAIVQKEMVDAVEKLQELLKTDGAVENIVDAIDDVNALLNTLTNAEGEGRLDLMEAANAAINEALSKLTQDLEKAQTELNNAIANGDAALDTKIADLNKAIENAEAAYVAADKAISDDLTAAKATLAGVQTRLESAEKTITDLQSAVETLKTLIDQNGEVDLTEVTAQINSITQKMETLDELGLSAFKTTVTETLATLGESVTALNNTVAGIDATQITTNKQAVEALDASLNEMKTELEALETLQTEVSEITGNIDSITTKLNDVDGKLAALESTLAELEKIATGDHGTIDKIQQALADVNKALEDLQGIEDHTRLEALETAAERVDTALAAIGAKLDAIDPEEIGANKTAIEGLGESLTALQETVTALGTDNDTTAESVQAMNTSLNALSEKVVATESRFAAAESAIGALQSAVVALQQANASNKELQAELNALKSEIGEEDKASGWQTATTVIAIVGLVCNAGLVTVVIFFERKHHVIVPILKNGYNKVTSKLKKSK